jgi:hypothetical protein
MNRLEIDEKCVAALILTDPLARYKKIVRMLRGFPISSLSPMLSGIGVRESEPPFPRWEAGTVRARHL